MFKWTDKKHPSHLLDQVKAKEIKAWFLAFSSHLKDSAKGCRKRKNNPEQADNPPLLFITLWPVNIFTDSTSHLAPTCSLGVIWLEAEKQISKSISQLCFDQILLNILLENAFEKNKNTYNMKWRISSFVETTIKNSKIVNMTQRNSKHKYQYQIDRISRLRKIPRDIIFEISLPKQISMDSTSMRTRLFVFYSLFSFICQVVGLNHNHLLLFSRIFLNLRKLRPKTMHKLRLISNKSQIHDATNLQIIRLLTFSLALNFREILGNICPDTTQ